MVGLERKEVDADDIGFILAPHINSCGRMATADRAVRLLAGLEDDGPLEDKAAFMVECNRNRRFAQDRTRDICMEAIAAGDCGELFSVIEAPGAHEGVAGIVAGSLKEQFHRPVCIVTPSESGLLKGTGRCIPGLDLHGMLSTCGELFERYGGHAGACGFSLPKENLEALRSRMDDLMRSILAERPDALDEKLSIEKVLEPSEKTLEFPSARRTRNRCLPSAAQTCTMSSIWAVKASTCALPRPAATAWKFPASCSAGRRTLRICCVPVQSWTWRASWASTNSTVTANCS